MRSRREKAQEAVWECQAQRCAGCSHTSPHRWGRAGLGVFEVAPSAHALVLHLLHKAGPWAAQVAQVSWSTQGAIRASETLAVSDPCSIDSEFSSNHSVVPHSHHPAILKMLPLFTFPGDLLTACSAGTWAKRRDLRAPQASLLLNPDRARSLSVQRCKAGGTPLRGASPTQARGLVAAGRGANCALASP